MWYCHKSDVYQASWHCDWILPRNEAREDVDILPNRLRTEADIRQSIARICIDCGNSDVPRIVVISKVCILSSGEVNCCAVVGVHIHRQRTSNCGVSSTAWVALQVAVAFWCLPLCAKSCERERAGASHIDVKQLPSAAGASRLQLASCMLFDGQCNSREADEGKQQDDFTLAEHFASRTLSVLGIFTNCSNGPF